MSQKVWEINGLSLELDLEDIETVERYEDAFEKMKSEETAIPRDGKLSVVIRAYCNMYRKLFSRIFGEETSEKIFAGVRLNGEAYDNIYLSFLDFVHEQISESGKRKAKMLLKYKPKK